MIKGNVKEFCILCDARSRTEGDFLAAWLSADVKMPAVGTRYGGYVRNSISSPITGFAIGAFAGIIEYWRTDRPVDVNHRFMPVIEGLDMSRSVSFLADEHIIREGCSAVKFMSLLRRKPGMSPAEFSKAWLSHHASLVRSVDEVWRLFRGYRQNHVIPGTCRHLDGSDMARPYDGIVEIWFDSLVDLEPTMMAERYRAVIRPDEETFVDLPNTRMFSTETIVSPANHRLGAALA
jgi:hypothetical protein